MASLETKKSEAQMAMERKGETFIHDFIYSDTILGEMHWRAEHCFKKHNTRPPKECIVCYYETLEKICFVGMMKWKMESLSATPPKCVNEKIIEKWVQNFYILHEEHAPSYLRMMRVINEVENAQKQNLPKPARKNIGSLKLGL